MRRNLSVLAVVVLTHPLSAPMRAQQPPATPSRPPAVVSYEQIRKRAVSMSELMPESGYKNQTAAEARSFGEVIGHTVDTNFGVCASVRKTDNPRKGQTTEAVVADKATLIALLNDSFTFCDPVFAALTPTSGADSNAIFVLTHTSEMLGLMGGYLRAHGLPMTNAEADRPKKKTDPRY